MTNVMTNMTHITKSLSETRRVFQLPVTCDRTRSTAQSPASEEAISSTKIWEVVGKWRSGAELQLNMTLGIFSYPDHLQASGEVAFFSPLYLP